MGLVCRYDGTRRKRPARIKKLLEEDACLVPVCPEQMGGLPTPRSKNHLTWNEDIPEVINEQGRDVTGEFVRGAQETLNIARLTGARHAILKSGSPSCGKDGVTTRLLRKEGIQVEVIDAPRE
ncbi:DUF523 domain-containing protein [candidate division WOR-3 bacterium]|nr:DUF523 domain-containing protein [candidate division WOR-3 bacterium]